MTKWFNQVLFCLWILSAKCTNQLRQLCGLKIERLSNDDHEPNLVVLVMAPSMLILGQYGELCYQILSLRSRYIPAIIRKVAMDIVRKWK